MLPSNPFTVDASIKDFFFDRQRIIDWIGRENARKLAKLGAFLRKRARTDILRRRAGHAPPGSPPHVHAKGDYATLKNILFGLDWANNALKVGPVGIPSMFLPSGASRRTVPELLEFGGTVPIQVWSMGGNRWNRGRPPRNQSARQKAAFKVKTLRAVYLGNPFMGPTLDKEIAAGTVGNVWYAGVAA